MCQASRRSWLPGQGADVEGTLPAYRETLRERLLRLVAAKVNASLIVERELSDDGLVGLDTAVADDASLEAMFAATRALEAGAEETLDEAHRLGAEPTPIPYSSWHRCARSSLRQVPPVAVTTTMLPDRRIAYLTQDVAVDGQTAVPTVAPDALDPTVPLPIGRVVRFDDLALLARPHSCRKAAPAGQLDLFAS